jgi:flavin-dependent dehydrogenase
MNGGGVIAVVGDAAGHINPFSGEGITEALNDGMLGVALAKALIAGDLTQVKRYSLANNVSSLALNRRLSYGVASELFHEPMHYRRLFDAILKYPEAGKLLTTFVKRDILGLKDVNAPILKALAMVARTDPSIAVALLKVFREAGRYLGGIIKQ